MDIFLSYYHGNKEEADHVDNVLREHGYMVARDIRDVDYKDDLEEYSRTIRNYPAAVCLISDGYLKSRKCMYEILQLLKEQEFKKKLFPIVFSDARIFDPTDCIDYMTHWNEKYTMLRNKATGIDYASLTEIARTLKLYTYIKTEIGDFISIIGNWRLWRYEKQVSRDFADLIEILGLSCFHQLQHVLMKNVSSVLAEKLHGVEYVPMELERGIVPEKGNRTIKKRSGQCSHKREWKKCRLTELLPFKKSYLLCSSVGRGKTTFLYFLAKQLLERDYIPVIYACNEVERLKPGTARDLLAYFTDVTSQYSGSTITREMIIRILQANDKRIIFLFDGLDQVQGTNYSVVSDLIEKSCRGYPYLITTRPSAALHLSVHKDYIFLRLCLLSQKALKEYFGPGYQRARNVTAFAPDVIRTPMLAYMIRNLLEHEGVENIKTRTDLYKGFLRYIFTDHNKDTYSYTKAMKIRENLQKLSYNALALDNPRIQKVSLDFCYNQVKDNITCEELTTFGLVNLAIEKTDFLYFTHQSFQEYFAACYATEHPECMEKILNEIWHPKWREVIRFLAGLAGEEFVRRIYTGTDNVIHSRLFLAVECVGELGEKDVACVREVRKGLNKIALEDPFNDSVLRGYILCNSFDNVCELLQDGNSDICSSTAAALGQLARTLPDAVLFQLVELLYNPGMFVPWTVTETLGRVGDNISPVLAARFEAILADETSDARSHLITSLGMIGADLPERIMYKLAALLQDKNKNIRIMTVQSFLKHNNVIPDMLARGIERMLKDPDYKVRIEVVKSLVTYSGHLPDSIAEILISFLITGKGILSHKAMQALRNNSGHLSPEILKKLTELLCDDNAHIRSGAGEILGHSQNRLSPGILNRLVDLLSHEDSDIRENVINVFKIIGKSMGRESLSCLVNLLSDYDRSVRYKAKEGLMTMEGNFPEEIVFRLGELLYENNSDVLIHTIDILQIVQSQLPGNIPGRLAELLKHRDRNVSMKAAYALGKREEDLGEPIMERLIVMAAEKDTGVGNSAVYTLVRSRQSIPESLIPLVRSLLDNAELDVQFRALAILGNYNGILCPKICDHAVSLFHHPDARIRKRTAGVFKHYKYPLPPAIIDELCGALHDPRKSVCLETIDTLGCIHEFFPESIIHSLMDFINPGGAALDKDRCLYTIAAFSHMGSRLSDIHYEHLLALMEYPDHDIRVHTMETLELISMYVPENLLIRIVALLEDEDDFVRTAAARILENHGRELSDDIIHELGTLLESPDHDLCVIVIDILAKIMRPLPLSIINQLIQLLGTHEHVLRYNAGEVLGDRIREIPEYMIKKIEKRLNDAAYILLKQLYEAGVSLTEYLPAASH